MILFFAQLSLPFTLSGCRLKTSFCLWFLVPTQEVTPCRTTGDLDSVTSANNPCGWIHQTFDETKTPKNSFCGSVFPPATNVRLWEQKVCNIWNKCPFCSLLSPKIQLLLRFTKRGQLWSLLGFVFFFFLMLLFKAFQSQVVSFGNDWQNQCRKRFVATIVVCNDMHSEKERNWNPFSHENIRLSEEFPQIISNNFCCFFSVLFFLNWYSGHSKHSVFLHGRKRLRNSYGLKVVNAEEIMDQETALNCSSLRVSVTSAGFYDDRFCSTWRGFSARDM